MTVDPIVKTVHVKAKPARAFELFVSHFSKWWPKAMSIGRQPLAEVVLEPRRDGRWYEVDGQGNETDWGKVLAWEPPSRLLLAWQINGSWKYDPEFLTELEIQFVPSPAGGTAVRLEHRKLERFGPQAAEQLRGMDSGWLGILESYATLANEAE